MKRLLKTPLGVAEVRMRTAPDS